jgi:hypothetical protein
MKTLTLLAIFAVATPTDHTRKHGNAEIVAVIGCQRQERHIKTVSALMSRQVYDAQYGFDSVDDELDTPGDIMDLF